VLARRSSVNSPQLPSFVSKKPNDAHCYHHRAGTAHRWSPDQACDRAASRRAAAVAKTAARRRALGNLAVTVFVVLACFMAAHALHADRQQIQQLERLQ
jgi:hypothetical protein